MSRRGFPSAASKAVVPQQVEVVERPRPPRTMPHEQCEVWYSIVAGQPADWFAPGALPLLVQLCRHVVTSNRLAEMIEHSHHDDEGMLLSLLKEQRSESASIKLLSMALRLTPQSLLTERGTKTGKATSAPWQFSDAAD